MTEKPKRFVFDLAEEDRDSLETVRWWRGLRSSADTLRTLIREAHATASTQMRTEARAEVLALRSPETPKPPPAARKPAVAKVSKPKVEPESNVHMQPLPKFKAGDVVTVAGFPGLQFGPTSVKPGERAKKPKGK